MNDEGCWTYFRTYYGGFIGQLVQFTCADKREVLRTSDDECFERFSEVCERQLVVVREEWSDVFNLWTSTLRGW